MLELEFIILNCLGTLTNMTINSQILDLYRQNRDKEILGEILEELREIRWKLKQKAL